MDDQIRDSTKQTMQHLLKSIKRMKWIWFIDEVGGKFQREAAKYEGDFQAGRTIQLRFSG